MRLWMTEGKWNSEVTGSRAGKGPRLYVLGVNCLEELAVWSRGEEASTGSVEWVEKASGVICK